MKSALGSILLISVSTSMSVPAFASAPVSVSASVLNSHPAAVSFGMGSVVSGGIEEGKTLHIEQRSGDRLTLQCSKSIFTPGKLKLTYVYKNEGESALHSLTAIGHVKDCTATLLNMYRVAFEPKAQITIGFSDKAKADGVLEMTLGYSAILDVVESPSSAIKL